MESILKNATYAIYGISFVFFLNIWIRLHIRKKKNNVLRILYWMFSYMVVVCIRTLAYLNDSFWDNEIFQQINKSIDLAFIPVFFVFLLSIISPQHLNKRYFIYAPSMLIGLISILTLNKTVFLLLLGYTVLFFIVATVLLLLAVFRYNNYIKNNFSNIDSKDLAWLKKGVVILIGFACVWGCSHIYISNLSIIIYYLSMMILWGLLYKYAVKHQPVGSTTIMETEGDGLYFDQDSFVIQFNKYMEEEKPFLNPNITLLEFASGVGTNRTYMSNYFNKTIGITFYDFINSYRIEIACILLVETDNTLDKIAELSGFNSLPTFRRSFLKLKNCTPNQYRKEQKAKEATCIDENTLKDPL